MFTHRSIENPILVLGSNGKTGRRVVERLEARGVSLRPGSRMATPPFDWTDRSTWAPALQGTRAVYVSYQPDLAVPGAVETVGSFIEQAVASGVHRLVLLSGRGEPEAERVESLTQNSGLEWTIVRSAWFSQNFSENFLLPAILAGELALPAGEIGEPFVDLEDVADVAATSLVDESHAGRLYEVTGPRLLSFAQAVEEIAAATGRPIRYERLSPTDFKAAMEQDGVPPDYVWFLDYLFNTVLDGRNAHVADGVLEALGRTPRDFTDYARRTAATGVWNLEAASAHAEPS